MSKRRIFRPLLFIILIAATSLACKLAETISTGVEVVSTGQAVANLNWRICDRIYSSRI